jgi:hypothetical protein
MRQDEHPTALVPFDSCGLVLETSLALSLAMDLAHTLGDKNAALR